MSLRIKHMQQGILLLVLLLTLPLSNTAAAESFDQFRLIGDHTGNTTGFVTSITFNREQSIATLHYVDVAGGSMELTAELTPSTSIRTDLPVYLPPADFLQPASPSLDLSGIDYLQGRISSADNTTPPPHWFRLTYYNERWSGVFRVDNRIYSIDRYTSEPAVAVRPARQGDLDFLPQSRIKISAVIDELYVEPDATGDLVGMDNLGHLFALESVHVLDGLLTDSLGITVWLEQLIYQPSAAVSDPLVPGSTLNIAENWADENADAFGLLDNLAIMFFLGSPAQQGTTAVDLQDRVNDHIAVIANSPHYQFTTAHAFGLTLGLPFEEHTMQHWQAEPDVQPDVLWSTNQKDYLDDHPLPESLVQTISYDAPEVPDLPGDEPAGALDEHLIIAEQPESQDLLSDDDSVGLTPGNNQADIGGTGAFAPLALFIVLLLQRLQRRYAYTL